MAKIQQVPNISNEYSRYIYFTSLSNEQSPSLNALGRHALNMLNNIDKQLIGIDKEKDKKLDGFTRIELYLQFLERTAKQMQQNEIIFIQQQIQKIKNIKTKFKDKDLDLIQDMLNNIVDGDSINYDQLITLLNQLLLNPKQKENIIKSQYNNIQKLDENFKRLSQDEQKNAEQAYFEAYEKYRTNFASKLKQDAKQNTIEIPYITSLMADKINSIISQLSNNQKVLDIVKNQLLNNGINTNALLEAIVGIIVDLVFENPEINTKELINNLTTQTITDINQRINQFVKSNSFDAFSKRSQKSLEQLAMRKENEFEGLANAALLIEDMDSVFEQYDSDGKYGLKQSYEELEKLVKNETNMNIINNKKGIFTRALGQAIQTNLINTVKNKKGITDFSEIKKVIKEESDLYYQKRQLKEELSTQLRITQIKTADIAEIAASREVHEAIVNIILDRVNGKSINLKTDISFTVGFSPKNGKTELPVKAINNIINKELKNFLPDYHEIAKGSTDTEKSREILINKMKNIIKNIEKKLKITDKNREEIEKMLSELYDAIFGSISVKDYDLYNNKLGFHGGSLGASGTPETVINNIVGMYKAGGISAIDADDILFTVLNSTDSTYGDEALKTHVANYLLGGAALAMFDEDFLTAQKFLDNTKSTLFNNNHIRSVQLYRLNSVYIPASYILYTIYQQLVPIYEDIALNFNNFPKTNNVIITTHNLTNADIPTDSEHSSAISRWDYISEQGIKNTKIQFMFMAGMLDIFKNLGNAFNISLNN